MAGEGGLDVEGTLGTKIGAFPLIGWLGIAAGGVGLGLLIRKFTSGGGSSGEGSADSTAAPSNNMAPSFTTQGAAYVPLNGGTGTPEPQEPDDNTKWERRAVTYLVAAGHSPATASTAIHKVLNGDPVTDQERALYDLAGRGIGVPPEPVPAITAWTPEPTYTTPVPTIDPGPAVAPPTSQPVAPAPAPAQPALDPNAQAWISEAQRLIDKANASIAGGPKLTDAEIDKMRGMGFTSSDTRLAPLVRVYYRIWLDQHGFAGQNA